MANHSVPDQLRFLTQWFRTWSEYQKDDFLHALAPKLSPSATNTIAVNGIVNDMEGLNTSGRPPSLFACQIKLFNEWWDTWSAEERGNLTEQLKSSDAKFWTDVENELDGSKAEEKDDFFNVDIQFSTVADTPHVSYLKNVTVTPTPECTNESTTGDSSFSEIVIDNENIMKDVDVEQEVSGEEFRTTIEVFRHPPAEEESSGQTHSQTTEP